MDIRPEFQGDSWKVKVPFGSWMSEDFQAQGIRGSHWGPPITDQVALLGSEILVIPDPMLSLSVYTPGSLEYLSL